MTTDSERLAPYPLVSLATLARTAGRYPNGRFLDDLALVASRGQLDADGLTRFARSKPQPRPGQFDPQGLSWFAYVVASRSEDESYALDAAHLFLLAYQAGGHRAFGRHFDAVRVATSYLAGTLGEHRPILEQSHAPEQVWWGVDADAARSDCPEHNERWLEVFNRPLRDVGLEPVRLEATSDDRSPFDRLIAPLATTPSLSDLLEPDGDYALISVVMPVYNPGPSLRTAVQSIIAQTWPNIEILLCDDASSKGRELLDELRENDPRIRVLRTERNRGAYAARNRGLAMARGQYVTFNDADDWSHPRRLERQMRSLRKTGGVHGSVSWSIRVFSDLRLTVVGRPSMRVNLSSILFRTREVREYLGGFDAVRKGADSEFVSRFRTVFGSDSIADLEEPLAMVQLTPGSLSRDDYRFLRTHPARLQYMSAFRAWHRQLSRNRPTDGFLLPGARAPFPAPAYISGTEASTPDFDIIVLASLDPDSSSAPDLAGELRTMARMGLRVGVLEYLAPFDLSRRVRPASGDMADLIHRGEIVRLLPGGAARARIGLIRDASAVEAMPEELLRPLEVPRYVVIADFSSAGGHYYQPRQVVARIGAVGGKTGWLPATKAIRAELVSELDDSVVDEPTLFGQAYRVSRARNVPSTARDKPGRIYSRPLRVGVVLDSIGALTDREALAILEANAPKAGICDLYTWGAPARVSERFRRSVASLDLSDASSAEVASLLDVAIVVPSRGRDAHLDRFAVTAMVRECITILDGQYREHFGTAALYLDEQGPTEWVSELASNPELVAAQRKRAGRFLDNLLGPEAFEQTVKMLLLGGRSWTDETVR